MANLKSRFFAVIPMFAKGFMLGFYSLLHARQKYGPAYKAELFKLRQRALMPLHELKGEQERLLAEFLCSLHDLNSHYREVMRKAALNKQAICANPHLALAALPVMEKSFLKTNLRLLASDGVASYAVSNTSGTSGSPMDIPYDLVSYQKGFAYWRRFYDDMGLPEKFKNARFSGRIFVPEGSRTRKFWIHDWHERRLFFSTYHLTPENIPCYLERLNSYRPELLDGYPSALAILARYMLTHEVSLTFIPMAIATTAETLTDSDRKLIEQAFKCKVFNQYASSEGAPFITECRAGSLHMNLDTGVFELLPVSGLDDVKELQVTSFRNIKLPLVRYRIGDTVRCAEVDSQVCACGSFMPRVAAIEGRLDDILYSTERGAIGRLDPVYKGVHGIRCSQIIQEDVDSFRILLVPDVDYHSETLSKLEKNFRDRVGASVSVDMELVSEIPLSANGKFKAVINKVPLTRHSGADYA